MPDWLVVVVVVVVAVPLVALRVMMRRDAMNARMEWGPDGTPVPSAAMRRHRWTNRVLGGLLAVAGIVLAVAGEAAGLLVTALGGLAIAMTFVLPHLATRRLRDESRAGAA